MRLNSLFLSNFRNFKTLDLEFCPHWNIFWGDNGQGKTNLIEALYCLGYGSSYRTNCDEELIKWEEKGLYLKGEGCKRKVFLDYEFVLSRNDSKIRKVNSHRVNLRDSSKWLWMVVFSPDDIWLIKGPPLERRNFLDAKLPLFNPRYPYLKSSYQRILSQRNYLLFFAKKNKRTDGQLESWDEQLIDVGSIIVKIRLEGLRKLSSFFTTIYPKINGKECRASLVYKSSFLKGDFSSLTLEEIKTIFRKELELKRKKEMEQEVTLVGPHRDDFLILRNGVSLRPFGSQGEQRMAALSLRLAELELVKSKEEDYPLSLLDDIAPELDPARQRLLLNSIKNQGQVFLTATNLSLFKNNVSEETYFYQVKANNVRRQV